jgi:hypothetical protein
MIWNLEACGFLQITRDTDFQIIWKPKSCWKNRKTNFVSQQSNMIHAFYITGSNWDTK